MKGEEKREGNEGKGGREGEGRGGKEGREREKEKTYLSLITATRSQALCGDLQRVL